jgi:SAM-dependent methyltransferase
MGHRWVADALVLSLMAIWVAKAVVQKSISVLPTRLRHPANEFFRRNITGGAKLSDQIMQQKLRSVAGHITWGLERRDQPVLELGSGWFPIVPVALYLSGFESINSVDIVHHMGGSQLREVVMRFIELHDTGQLHELLPHYEPSRISQLRAKAHDRPDGMSAADINLTLTTADARQLDIPSASIGLITSNNTFEHIYPDILSPVLSEFRRILRPDGIMSHHVDLSDHFSHLDRKITPFNFLRFSDRAWRMIDNSIQPQSRLRADDYRKLFSQSGWESAHEDSLSAPIETLQRVPLNARFASKPPDVNAIIMLNAVLTPC